jgi:hypothetical protein
MASCRPVDTRTYDNDARVQATVKYVFQLQKRQLQNARGTVFEKRIIVGSVEFAGKAQQPNQDEELDVYFIDEVRAPSLCYPPACLTALAPLCERTRGRRACAMCECSGAMNSSALAPGWPAASDAGRSSLCTRHRRWAPALVLSWPPARVALTADHASSRPRRSGPRRATSWTGATSYS